MKKDGYRHANPRCSWDTSVFIRVHPRLSRSPDERTHVFADAALHLDIEAGLGGDIEERARGVILLAVLDVENHGAGAGNDFHALGFLGSEVKLAGINQSEGFLGAVRKQNAVTDHLAVEINISPGD